MWLNIMHHRRKRPNILVWSAISQFHQKVHMSVLVMATNWNVISWLSFLISHRSRWTSHICTRTTQIWTCSAEILHGLYQMLKIQPIGYTQSTFVSWIFFRHSDEFTRITIQNYCCFKRNHEHLVFDVQMCIAYAADMKWKRNCFQDNGASKKRYKFNYDGDWMFKMDGKNKKNHWESHISKSNKKQRKKKPKRECSSCYFRFVCQFITWNSLCILDEGVYNTYIIDTDYREWALIMHCAEKEKSNRYLSALMLSRTPTIGNNVINFLRFFSFSFVHHIFRSKYRRVS